MKKYLFIIILLSQVSIYPQYFLNEPAPLQRGNYWIYSYYGGGTKFSYKVLDSTVIIDSSSYYLIEYSHPGHPEFGKYYQYNRIDTNNFYIRYGKTSFKDSLVLYYKKNASIYDSWRNIFAYELPNIVYYSISDTGTITWNGYKTKFKELYITDSGLVEQYQYWSDDFGLLNVIDFESGSNFLVACVINGKVYGDTTVTGLIKEKTDIPVKFTLSQNYPNPFNPSTRINFDIPEAGFVTLKVYDILGREIKDFDQ